MTLKYHVQVELQKKKKKENSYIRGKKSKVKKEKKFYPIKVTDSHLMHWLLIFVLI